MGLPTRNYDTASYPGPLGRAVDLLSHPTKRGVRVSGLLAGGLALGFLWAASRVARSAPFPPFALADRIIRVTPGGVATFFIDTLGAWATRLLATVAVLVGLALAAFLPELSAWRGRLRPSIAGALVAMGALAADLVSPEPPHVFTAAVSSSMAGLLYAASLAWLTGGATGLSVPFDASRRAAMAWMAGSAAALALGGTVVGRVARRLAGPDTDVSIRRPDVAAAAPTRPPFPSIPGLSPEVTSPSDHYVVDIDLLDPAVEAAGWVLRVHGLVDRPLDLGFFDLQRDFLLVEEYAVLTCISNPVGGPLVGSSSWIGVRLRDILQRVGTAPGAAKVVFRCADGYSSSIPLPAAMDSAVLLAIAQDGKPLEQHHGFPCRVRAPAFYGVKNAKWLEEIEVIGRDYRDYWTVRGWSQTAVVRTESRIDTVGTDVQTSRPTWVAGVAWAGIRGISRVEVSVDGGSTWNPALLHPPLSPYAWTQWAFRWTPARAGTYRVQSRATDGDGITQDRTRRRPHPSGASGYPEVQVRA